MSLIVGIVIALILSILVAIFAIANTAVVMISFVLGQMEVSLVIVVLAAAGLGALIIGTIGLPGKVKTRMHIRGLNRRIRDLERRVSSRGRMPEEIDEERETL